ncbi:MAG: tetratricopeptide repeat protein [Candidatus Omnitrophica bacterium]|nr:tetratricopeptide repeat protein [Candidatus Omnitrophota bacterium]MCG2712163.1 tetratricopeptide repeat protein [Candidatus Omnitrophota bacterium]
MRTLIALLVILVFVSGYATRLSATVPEVESKFSNQDDEDDYQRTIAGLKKAIEADPENYENYSRLAFFCDYIGDYENALEALKLEVKYMPEDLEAKDVIYGNLAREYLLTGRIDEAKPWLAKADKINPDNIFNRWHSFTYHILKTQYKTAAKELKRLTELNPTDRDHYYEAYMFILEKVEDQKSIVDLFREAVKANPKSHLSHRALGIAIRNSSREDYEKNMPEAMRELEKALEIDPSYIPTYISLADTYMLLGAMTKKEEDNQKALEWFNKACEINPEDLRLAFAMGTFYYHRQDYDNAIEKLEYAYTNGLDDVLLKENLAWSYNNKAYALYQAGKNLDEGLRLIDKAIQLVPGNGIILGTKAELLYKSGKYKEAYKYIKQALELEPDYEEMKQDLVMIEEALKTKD